jgi:hypothetical protein
VADASELSDLSGRRKWDAMDHSQKVLTIQIAMKVDWDVRCREEVVALLHPSGAVLVTRKSA